VLSREAEPAILVEAQPNTTGPAYGHFWNTAPYHAALHGLVTIAVVFILIPALLWVPAGWIIRLLQPTPTVSIAVFDETVPDSTYGAHQALGLALDSLKVPFSASDGYVGAAPGGAPAGSWPANRPDLVMLADAYGVYANDAGHIDPEGTIRVSGRFERSDAELIDGWHRQGTWLYGETQILGPPTPNEAAAILESVFSVHSTGWSGRWYDDLSSVPSSLRTTSWDYSGPGIVMVSAGAELVLTGDDLTSGPPRAIGWTQEGRRYDVPFVDWFEIVDTTETVDARLELPVTTQGAATLAGHGIPQSVPLVIRGTRTLYIAGDVSSSRVRFPLRTVAGSATLMAVMPQTGQAAFFYRAYLPAVTWLVDEAGG
jgi:hypothetical protein